MADFAYDDMLPIGEDATPYRLLTTEGVETVEGPGGRTFLEVAPEALTLLTETAMHDIAHYLRPAHLRQLASILDDPEASPNDKFVALDLLKNANIAAGGVLPMCQDTGTAIVMGKRGQHVLTDGADERPLSLGVYDAYTRLNLRYSQIAPAHDVGGEEHRLEPAGPDRAVRRHRARTRGELQVPVHGQGRRIGEQVLPVPGDQGDPEPRLDDDLPRGEDPLARHGRLPAVPPRDRHRRHLGGVRAEDREVRLRQVPRHAAHPRRHDRRTGSATSSSSRRCSSSPAGSASAPSSAASTSATTCGWSGCRGTAPRCPVAIAVSCSADRQALGKITPEGVFLEQLEFEPAQYLPDHVPADLDDGQPRGRAAPGTAPPCGSTSTGRCPRSSPS